MDDDATSLVSRAAGGDPAAWNALVDRYNGLLWSIARSYRLRDADASDVLQTAWMRLLEHLDRIEDPERPGVRVWELTLPAKGEQVVELRYEVKWPKGFPIQGLE